MNKVESSGVNLFNSINSKDILNVTSVALAAIALTTLAILNPPLLIAATITLASLTLLSYPAYRLALVIIDSYKGSSLLDSRPERPVPPEEDTPIKPKKPLDADILKQIKPPFLDTETLEQAERLGKLIEGIKKAVSESIDQIEITRFYLEIRDLLDSFIVKFKLGAAEIKLVTIKIGLLPLLASIAAKLEGHSLKSEVESLRAALSKSKKSDLNVSDSGIVKTLTDRIVNLTAYDDAKGCRIKASKYEALFNSLSAFKSEWPKLAFKAGTTNAATLINEIIGLMDHVNPELSTLDYLNDVRVAWENTIPKLRELSELALDQKSGLNPEVRKLIFDVTHTLYFKTDLKKENEELLRAVLNGKSPADVSLEEILAAYQSAPASLTTHSIDRALKSLNDVFGNHFCPLKSGNPPQKMFEMDGVSVIGMGCPTYQLGYEIGKGQPAATVDPIFLAALHNLEEPHLYVSNQDHTSSEHVRNEPVMNIRHKNFFAITINKNNKLYEGEGPDKAQDYKFQLVRQYSLPIEQSGCHIPSYIWPTETRKAILRDIANEIHTKIFKGKETLTKQDRRLFISLFNAHIILRIRQSYRIKSFNLTCKDGIDRGMNSLAFLVSILLMEKGVFEEKSSKFLLAEILFTRAYWARKRHIMGDRFLRYMEDISHLLKLLKALS